jgi:precorrin-8X/cobalt-precorrin-8 methylmutase
MSPGPQTSPGSAPHPIEAESYRILRSRLDLSGLSPGPRAVVERVVHATADLEYATTMWVTEQAVDAGVAALSAGAVVVADVEMVRAGVTSVPTRCYLGEVGTDPERPDAPGTRAAAAMRIAAARHPRGAVVVVGCAPTALVEVLRLSRSGRFSPALVVGVPVGFVGAAEAKAALRRSGLVAITNVGDKGGAAVGAAVVNALARLAGRGPASRTEAPALRTEAPALRTEAPALRTEAPALPARPPQKEGPRGQHPCP